MNKDEGEIRHTLQYFFDGLDNLDADLIKQAFYPESQSFHITQEGSIGKMAVSEWDNSMQSVRANPDHPINKNKSRKNVLYIDVTGTAASAKVEWIFPDFMFTDYYNLLKINGRWYIVNKTYHTTLFKHSGN